MAGWAEAEVEARAGGGRKAKGREARGLLACRDGEQAEGVSWGLLALRLGSDAEIAWGKLKSWPGDWYWAWVSSP